MQLPQRPRSAGLAGGSRAGTPRLGRSLLVSELTGRAHPGHGPPSRPRSPLYPHATSLGAPRGAERTSSARELAETLPQRLGKTRSGPLAQGALQWLYSQAEVDVGRGESFLQDGCSRPERHLRKALRRPLQLSEGDAAREERLVTKLTDLVQEVTTRVDPGAQVLEAGQLRITKLKEHCTKAMLEAAKQARAPSKSREPSLEEPTHHVGHSLVGRTTDPASFAGIEELSAGGAAQAAGADESVASLAAFLVERARTEEQKAWAIFCWVAHHVEYDAAGARGGDARPCGAEDVLRNRVCLAQGYANLFTALATHAGLRSEVVAGHVRDIAAVQHGGGVCDHEGHDHFWSAVLVGGEWALLDCAWGSGTCDGSASARRFRPYFFGPPPDQLGFSHFPSDKMWQLLRVHMSRNLFVARPMVAGDLFFGLGQEFAPDPRPSGTIVLENTNAGALQLKAPKAVAASLGARLDGEDMRGFVTMATHPHDPHIAKVTVHFRAPRCDAEHTLEIFTTEEGGAERRVCAFAVQGPEPRPQDFVEPYFPTLRRGTFEEHGLSFSGGRIPNGLVVAPGGSNEVSLQLFAEEGVRAIAEVAPSQGGPALDFAATVQIHPEGVLNVLAQCPPGEHSLRVLVRRSGGGSYAEAVAFQVRVADCPGLRGDGMPAILDDFADLGGALEAPFRGLLQQGQETFRLCLDAARAARGRVLLRSGPLTEELPLSEDGSCGASMQVTAPGASLLFMPGASAEEPKPRAVCLVQWRVA